MNKKRDTNNDSKRKKRCKSKNIDDKKWERPAGYYKEYETRRGGGGPRNAITNQGPRRPAV